jgi:hypothetical protein
MFREHRGFRKFSLPRYFVPLSRKGQLAIGLGIQMRIEYSLHGKVERALLKLYNSASRMAPAAVWWRFGGE